jgi:alanyl-tRNA synthetase
MSITSGIRSRFLQYFGDRGHEIVDSSSLVPENDPSLLFANAGMVQFKDTFTGRKDSRFKRATTAQKCLRAGGKHNDLENVGYTGRHHTFFEMLGNFSFGDYFREEAIPLAWDFVVKELSLPKDRLLVTVHACDTESALIWKNVACLDESRIIRISSNDNFWSMGPVGPCGPCTEIFYDYGDRVAGGPPGSADSDGNRFVEIWNIVFMQYETLADGARVSLPKPSIDTGMGLERISAILHGVCNNFDIDIFSSIISDIKNITNNDDLSFVQHNNVVADHIRAIAFMISDGIVPSNEGRGYVLRRIIRRALRHGYSMGVREPFLFRLVSSVSRVMGRHYAELLGNEGIIVQILKLEEESFMRTIDKGMHLLDSELLRIGGAESFPADSAYKLYDTFGFPVDLTQDIIRSKNKKIDMDEFERISKEQRELSRVGWKGSGDVALSDVWLCVKESCESVDFIRDVSEIKTKILFIICDGKLVSSLSAAESGFVVTERSCFYAESGGQVGDSGLVQYCTGENVSRFVGNTVKIAGVLAHEVSCCCGYFPCGSADYSPSCCCPSRGGRCACESFSKGALSGDQESNAKPCCVPLNSGAAGKALVAWALSGGQESNGGSCGILRVGDLVSLQVDFCRRLDISRNHTCTHLLQSVLRKVLDSQVAQKGSLVSSERLRFDFVHNAAISMDQIKAIEVSVNRIIDDGLVVSTEILSIKDAIASGATALFGEKYGDSVRVVSIGPHVSKELCGGTHVKNTQEIKAFKIISVSSIGSGIKRIEAVTGNHLVRCLDNRIAGLRSSLEEKDFIIKNLEKQIADMRVQVVLDSVSFIVEQISGVDLFSASVTDFDHKSLLKIIDSKKQKDSSRIVVVANKSSKTSLSSCYLYASDLIVSQMDAMSIFGCVSSSMRDSFKYGGKAGLAVASGLFAPQVAKILRELKQSVKKNVAIEK